MLKIEVDFDGRKIYVNGHEVSVKNTNYQTLADIMEDYEGAQEYEGIVEKIQVWYYGYLSKTPWCCTCISYFAHIMGLDSQIPKNENVDRLKEYMISKNMFDATANYGGGAYRAKRGDLIFFSSANTLSDCTHIGVIKSIDYNSGEVTWIGGNTSDKIMTKTNNMFADLYVVGFGRVDY